MLARLSCEMLYWMCMLQGRYWTRPVVETCLQVSVTNGINTARLHLHQNVHIV